MGIAEFKVNDRLFLIPRFLGRISQTIRDRIVIVNSERKGFGELNTLKKVTAVRFAAVTRQIFVPMRVVVKSLSGFSIRKYAIIALLLFFCFKVLSLILFVDMNAVSAPAKNAQKAINIIVIIILGINSPHLH